MEIKALELTQLKLSELNPRRHFDEAKIKELAASIREKGVIEPIIVRPSNGKYEIVCGNRRFKAAQLASLKNIPSIIKELTDQQALEFQVIENLQREDIHPLEEAEGYEALMKKHGYKTVDDIAAKVGKSKAYIYGRLKLCELIPENRKLFYEDKFSPSVALLVSRIPANLQLEVGKIIARGGDYGDREPMSYRRAKEYIHENFMLQLKEAPFDPKDKALGGKGSCSECPKRTGNQKELFPDVSSADVCTDPGCFTAKKNAFAQRAVAKLKAEGKTVVSPEEAKKLFRYESSDSPEYKYESLDETCYEAPKNPKYRQLVKACKDAKIVYAIHPNSGKVIEMIERAEIPAILKKAGIKINTAGAAPVKDIAKAKAENRVRFAKRDFWISRVSTANDRRCMNVVILDILLNDLGASEANELLPFKSRESYYRSWTIPKLYELGDEEVQKLIIKVISKKSEVLNDDSLEFLCGKLGFSLVKDYTITESYLEACTKKELVKLAKELGIPGMNLESGKKDQLVEYILKKAPKGKVPKELMK